MYSERSSIEGYRKGACGRVMKKVLIAQEVNSALKQKNSFLNRVDITVFTAASNDEALKIHRAEGADLIITHLDMPGMSSEQFSSLISEELTSRRTLLVMVCASNTGAIERCSRCGAHAVILRPVNPSLLLAKAQQLLDISWRETCRVLLSASVEGKAGDETFFCRSQDISASGMLIETEKTLSQGGRVRCSFVLPDSTKVQATGEIVRIIQQASGAGVNRYGVRFLNLPPDTRRALDGFVDKKVLEKLARVA